MLFEQNNINEIKNIWTNYFEVKNLNVKWKKKLATYAICAGHHASYINKFDRGMRKNFEAQKIRGPVRANALPPQLVI